MKSWASTPSEDHAFFISGKPGTGKSTLAATLTQHFKRNKVLCAQYFISRNFPGTTDPHKFFPTVALQLAERSQLAASVIAQNLDTERPDRLGYDQAESLLLEPLNEIAKNDKMATIVLDGLDELDEVDENVFDILAYVVSKLQNNVKVVISARPENPILVALRSQCKTIELATKDSVDEVGRFIHDKIKEITAFKPALQGWPTSNELDMLSKQADGLFHYAATLTRWIAAEVRLRGEASPNSDFLDKVRILGAGSLDELYQRILSAWPGSGDEEFLQHFHQVVGYLIVLEAAPSIGDLRVFLGVPNTVFDLTNFFEQMRSILIPGLTDITDDTIPGMHSTFRDYITTRSSDKFCINKREAHLRTTMACLQIVIDDEEQLAFRYAYLLWPYQLNLAITSGDASGWDSNDKLLQLMKILVTDSAVFSRWNEYCSYDNHMLLDICDGGWQLMKVSDKQDKAIFRQNNELEGALGNFI